MQFKILIYDFRYLSYLKFSILAEDIFRQTKNQILKYNKFISEIAKRFNVKNQRIDFSNLGTILSRAIQYEGNIIQTECLYFILFYYDTDSQVIELILNACNRRTDILIEYKGFYNYIFAQFKKLQQQTAKAHNQKTMKVNSIFIDSVNNISQELETNLIHLITSSSKKVVQKLESLTIEVLHFKGQFFRQIANLIKDNNTVSKSQVKTDKTTNINSLSNQSIFNNSFQSLKESLQTQLRSIDEQLFKYNLHKLLKKKLNKKRRQSMLSIQFNQSKLQKSHNLNPNLPKISTLQNEASEQIQNLQHSIILIEKDLGLDQQQDELDKLSQSTINHNKMLFFSSIVATPIKSREQEILSSGHKYNHSQSLLDSSIASQMSETSQYFLQPTLSSKPKDMPVDNFTKSKQNRQLDLNQEYSLSSSLCLDQDLSQPNQNFSQSHMIGGQAEDIKGSSNAPLNKKASIMNKKKKIVSSKNIQIKQGGTGKEKQGLFDNLLEETLSQVLKN